MRFTKTELKKKTQSVDWRTIKSATTKKKFDKGSSKARTFKKVGFFLLKIKMKQRNIVGRQWRARALTFLTWTFVLQTSA